MVDGGALKAIARELYDETDDSLIPGGSSVYGPLVRWQLKESRGRPFLYPEPFNGVVSGSCAVLFLGMNAIYRPDEDLPSTGVSFQEYFKFYRTRLHEIQKDGFPAHRSMGGELKRIPALERITDRYLTRIKSPLGSLRFGKNCMYANVVPFWSSKWQGRIGAQAYLRKGGRWNDVLAACDRRVGRLVKAAAPGLTVLHGAVAKDLFPELEGLQMSDAPILSIRRDNIEFPVQWLYDSLSATTQSAAQEYYAVAAAQAQAVLSGQQG